MFECVDLLLLGLHEARFPVQIPSMACVWVDSIQALARRRYGMWTLGLITRSNPHVRWHWVEWVGRQEMEKTEADVDKWEDDSHTARGITVLTGTQAVHYATVERLQVTEEEKHNTIYI